MQNGIIIILIGAVVILIGLLYAGNDFEFFNASLQSEMEETVEENGASESSGTSNTPVSTPPPKGVVGGTTSEVVDERPLQSGVTIVTYTNDGFTPPVIEVVAGEQVHFINRSNKALWVTARNHPTAKDQRYPEFDQGKTISNGGTYTFVFTKIGVWGYKNLNEEEHLGTVSVIKQN